MILNYIIKHKCFTEYIIVIIVSTHESCFNLISLGSCRFLDSRISPKIQKLMVKTNIKTYM